MNDIDFEELDRAVSSALGPTQGSAQPAVSTAPSVASAPEVASPVPAPAETPVASPAARRSSGRFMDVVHPSSDMRSGGGSTQSRPLEVPSRPAAPQEVPAASDDSEAPSASGSSFQWPDPIDMADTPKIDSAEPIAEPAATETQNSPFLNTDKIEKRPLGAFSAEKTSEVMPEAASEPSPETPTEPAAGEAAPSVAEAGAVDVSALDMSEEALIGATTQPDTEPEVAAGPVAITQQYKEQPSTTEQPSGAIYDTESYHKPLAHPAKKQSSVMLVVWIIGLILLGGGLGAAMYFFVLPLL